MGLLARLRGNPELERSAPLSLQQWLDYFTFSGHQYPYIQGSSTLGEKQEEPEATFAGYVQGAYQSNGVIFACMLVRLLLFSEARFQFRQRRSGRPGDLFGTEALAPLEQPWRNATTGDLLTRAIQDADLAGNFYAVRRGDTIKRLRPDWVTIVLGSELEPDDPGLASDAEVIGYIYQPGGYRSSAEPLVLLPEQVCHFAPIPDPVARFRGMSWLTPVIREIMADAAATTHKLKFFENGATPNMVVSLDPQISQQQFELWRESFTTQHEGLANAYRTLILGGGAKAEVVGADMRQLEFKITQGAGETRIAAAAGVPPVIVGLSEGLQAATYSNYGQARRRFADGTMRPLWRNIAGSLASIVDVPAGAELWYDDRDIPFLQEDEKDAAEILKVHASTINTLIIAGYEPDSVVDGVIAGDLSRLVHSGLVSVQLQPPGATLGGPNGNGNGSPQIEASAARALERARALELPSGPTTVEVPIEVRQQPVIVNVPVPEVVVNVPEPTIRVEAPVEVNMPPQPERTVVVNVPEQPVVVNVPESPAPVVNVHPEVRAPDVAVTNVVEPASVEVSVPEQLAPTVEVNVPEQPAPLVNVTTPAPVVNVEAVVESPERKITFERDSKGRIKRGKVEDA